MRRLNASMGSIVVARTSIALELGAMLLRQHHLLRASTTPPRCDGGGG